MRPVCVVTNFNYGRFLPQCLDSLVEQTHAFDKVILIDDGSSDGSLAVARPYGDRLSLEIIEKANGGQLSCFHAAMKALTPDDLVFFLDADDFLPSYYVSTIMGLARDPPASFIFCAPLVVPAAAGQEDLPPAPRAALEWIPRSRALTLGCRLYVGSPTSGLCISFGVLQKLLPYPNEGEWRTCADNVLVFGASILGVQKAFVRGLQFAYRQHDSNVFMGRKASEGERSANRRRVTRLLSHYAQRAGVGSLPSVREAFSELAGLPAGWQNDHFVKSKARYVVYRAQSRARSLFERNHPGA